MKPLTSHVNSLKIYITMPNGYIFMLWNKPSGTTTCDYHLHPSLPIPSPESIAMDPLGAFLLCFEQFNNWNLMDTKLVASFLVLLSVYHVSSSELYAPTSYYELHLLRLGRLPMYLWSCGAKAGPNWNVQKAWNWHWYRATPWICAYVQYIYICTYVWICIC